MIPKDYITVTRGMRGYFAVHVTWNLEGFWEPQQSGVGSYATAEEAEVEAKMWARSEGLEFKPT